MTSERWNQISDLCQRAMACSEHERTAMLDEACRGDEALRREVDALLEQQTVASRFLSKPAFAAEEPPLDASRSSSLTGHHLGPYEVTARLGAGGMGEVFRARDKRLARDVAIKILPTGFVSDPDRRARFEREARMLAALNHPHIGAIYGVEEHGGVPALVLELVEGPTLADRLKKGPLPIPEAASIAAQIANALEAAHEKGIVHRDLKPANIKITPAGTVKVLDFGLAKPTAPNVDTAELTSARTIAGTREGVIVGTPAYMSPEQARGKPVDKRVDIWAFGCVLFEMLTGRTPFVGETMSDMIAAVLEQEPYWQALPAGTPESIRRLLERSLTKDPTRRLRDIGDARVELDEIRNPPAVVRAGAPLAWWRSWPAFGAAVTVMSGVVLFTLGYLQRSTVTNDATQFVLLPPDGTAFGTGVTDRVPSFAVSPEGRHLVFVATDQSGRRSLWVRELRSLSAESLAGTEGASFPFWSPDGAFIAFFAQGKLKKVARSGGTPLTLADAQPGLGGTWNRAGVIVFAANGQGLFRVPDNGSGVAAPVTALDAKRQERAHVLPQFLPDGRHFIYLVRATQPHGGVYVGSLDSLGTKRLLSTDQKGMYVAPGYLLFLRSDTLFAQPFDAIARTTSGEPVPIVASVAFSSVNGRAAFSISDNGVLAYRTSGIPATNQPVWTDRSGTRLTAVGVAGDYQDVRLSPDESRLVAELHDLRTGTGDLWLLDLKRGSTSRFTFDGSHNNSAVWSPDGTRIVFAARGRSEGVANLHHKLAASGAETDEPLLPTGPDRVPTDWSSDGRYLLFQENHPKTRTDLWVLQMPERKASPYLQTEFVERDARFSPDGHWVAFVSNESGKDEVYVRPFPDGIRRWPISIDGGVGPEWRSDGKELFYASPSGNFMSVTIETTPQFNPGPPRPLFAARIRNNNYSVSRDGQRVLLNPVPEGPTAPAPPITVVIDWTSVLKK